MLMRFKSLTLSLCLIGLSSVAWAQPILIKSEQKIEEYKLDNGFRVVLAPNDKENKVFVNTIYFTGSLNDPKGKGGLAHLLEHLAFKGTENVKGDEFQRRLDQYTLMTNASTDYYSTKYTNVVRPEKTALNEIIYLEAERMDKLVLQKKFVPSEIAIVKREREVRMDQPFAVLLDEMWKSAYGNQSLGRLPIGDLNELQSINMDELNAFYRAWYAPNNAVMVIAGKFDKAEVLKQIDAKFSHIPARAVPAQHQVALLDSTKFKQRQFLVKKGSDFAKFNIYLNGKNKKIQSALSLAPPLYTMQPSGHLYQSIVETGTATGVQATTWLGQDFNLVFMGADYAPNHDPKKVETALAQGVENSKPFDDRELKRVKNIAQNAQDTLMSSATAVGAMLSDYVVSEQGNWAKYFSDQQALQNMSVDEVNHTLKAFLIPEHRITGDIQPTPEDQKKALEQKTAEATPKTLDQADQPAEPLKDVKTYQQEVTQFVAQSQKNLIALEQKIERGTLKNGMQYALFPTNTRDDKTYATISINFGDEKSLFNKAEIVDLTAYLLLRGSEKYTLQDIADQSIEAGGTARAVATSNGMNIQIVAKKEKFADFFDAMMSVMQAPKFEQSQFDLIKSQSLSSLDRPYTEPETVAALTIARLIEIYQPGDLRYHFEPELSKKQLNAATQQQVTDFYQKFFAMNHGQVAITGEFNAKEMKKILEKDLGQWSKSEPYKKISSDYTVYKAQKVHALSEQRQFGSYQSLLTLPLGVDHQDAAALIVFSHIFGNSQLSSRLGQELREKNALVYGFGSDLDLDAFKDVGAFSISANYTAGKSAQVSQVVHKVLTDLLTQGVTEQEVEAAKADIMKQRVTSLEDERNVHRMLNGQLERDKKMASRAVRDQEIAKLTKADVDAVIKKYIRLDQLVEVMADQYGQVQNDSAVQSGS